MMVMWAVETTSEAKTEVSKWEELWWDLKSGTVWASMEYSARKICEI